MKINAYDLLLARYGPHWESYAALAEAASGTEARFITDPREAICGEIAPYARMSSFCFSMMRALISLFGERYGVPSELILAPPRLACAVAETLCLPSRAVDELQLAAYLCGIARAVRQDEVTFAGSVELATESPFRVQRLIRAALSPEVDGTPYAPGRILRLVLAFLSELKNNGGNPIATLLALRERGGNEDGPVLEALVTVLQRERVFGLNRSKPKGDVLIVDTQESVARSLQMGLRNEGYDARVVSNGTAADSELSIAPPDLLIAATSLPGTDGYSLCLKAKSRFDVPTVLIADGANDDFSRLRAEGVKADGLFPRPVELRKVLARALELLASAGSHRQRPVRCTGSLAQLSPRALVDFLRKNGAPAVIHFWSSDQFARVRVADGKISHIQEERRVRLDEVLDWGEGTFMAFAGGAQT